MVDDLWLAAWLAGWLAAGWLPLAGCRLLAACWTLGFKETTAAIPVRNRRLFPLDITSQEKTKRKENVR